MAFVITPLGVQHMGWDSVNWLQEHYPNGADLGDEETLRHILEKSSIPIWWFLEKDFVYFDEQRLTALVQRAARMDWIIPTTMWDLQDIAERRQELNRDVNYMVRTWLVLLVPELAEYFRNRP